MQKMAWGQLLEEQGQEQEEVRLRLEQVHTEILERKSNYKLELRVSSKI